MTRIDLHAASAFPKTIRTVIGLLLLFVVATRGAEQSQPQSERGYITFAVNTHDWGFVEESAETVLRLIDIFQKHGARGEFYLTAPLVEQYVAKRPEVIRRLKESGMTISYHVRPPHPLWRGFDAPLRGGDITTVLRDYETYQLDLTTGGLNRAQPGGYRYVEHIFGRKPVAVGTSDALPPIKAASSRVYAELGAKVAVYHHETGTKSEQPFEFRDGLLVRPSDFSITRFPLPGNPQGVFWWNMVGTARAAEFDPVAALQRQLAAWRGPRPPFVTALIHENDFYCEGGPGWTAIYRARTPPFDLNTPPNSRPRSTAQREAIFRKYEELVAAAVPRFKVVTSEDLAAMAVGARAQTAVPAKNNSQREDPPPFDASGRPNRNQLGPWNNDVLVYRVTTGKAPEKLATFERAGVPTVARLQDGRLIAAHQHFPADNDADFDKVAVRFSSDEGRTWSAPQVIRVSGLPEGMRFPFDPTLVPLPDGRVRLYFTGNFGRAFQQSTPAIHSAISTDGLNYTYEPGVRFGVEGQPVIDCAVVLHRGMFHLYAPNHDTGYHATSRDGLNFIRADDVRIGGRRRWLGNAQSDGRLIYFFGTGESPWPIISTDGNSWEITPDAVRVPGADPGAVRLRDGSWLLLVTSPPVRNESPRRRDDINRPVPGTEAATHHYVKVNPDSDFTPPRGGVAAPGGPAPMRLMIATSLDGLKFTRRNLIVTDQGAVPDLVVDQNGWIWLYYQAASVGDEVNRIALAVSKDNGASWTFRKVTLRGFSSPKPDPCDPEIQLTEDGTFRLFVTWSERGGQTASWLAESRDGMNFQLVGKAFDPGGTALDPSVVKLGDTWHIFAGGGRGPDENWHGTSRDGKTFIADRPMRFTANGVNCMMANGISVPGGVRFYAFNNPRHGQPHRIYSFFTQDGITWTADPGIRLDADGLHTLEMPGFGVQDPAVGRLRDGTYLMIYTTRIPSPHTQRSANITPKQSPPTDLRSNSLSVRIPSSAAGNEGIAASVLIPRQPRYPEGAPVVIHVAGGVQAGSARGKPEYVQHGFVEIHFAFPGGGFGEERSGGTYDFRGANCVRALADVIRFAMSEKLAGVVTGMKVLTNNVGIVGSSHGGNACGLAMAKHGGEFPNLAWYASMESPYGEGAANVELGSHESGLNPAYDPKTGKLDLSRLAWSSELSPGLFRKPMLTETRQLKGAFYFDINRDGRFARTEDFPANCFVGDAGTGVKAWYSPRLLAEAEQRSLISGNRPSHVPTLAESREFWHWRDAAPHIPAAVRNCPTLAVIVYANERDHVQADPAHTHILEQVEGFRKAGARFVRLNPDRAYVDRLAPFPARFADNPAGKTWTRANIREGLEPASVPIGIYMQAAVCELADRVHAAHWSPDLGSVLHSFPGRP